MNTDRLGSGPSLVGISQQLPEARNRKPDNQEKAPESFADLVAKKNNNKATDKQTESKPTQKPDTGRSEAGSRTSKDLSVKRQKDGERPVEKQVEKESDNEATQKSEDFMVASPKVMKPKVSQTPKQRAMQEFMDSLEGEFGIPPERIVVAMAQLSDQEMLKAPEDTASQIIQKLELSPEQSEQAQAHYMSMLNQLRIIDNRRPEKMFEPTPEQMAWLQAAGGLGAVGRMAEIKNPIQGQSAMPITLKDRKAVLEDSLSKLSQKFFLNASDKISDVQQKLEAVAVPKEESSLVDAYRMQNDLSNSLADAGDGLEFGNLKNMPNVNSDLTQVPVQPNAEKMMAKNLAAQNSYKELADKMSAVNSTAVDLAQSIRMSPENRMALKMEQGLNQLQGTSAPNIMPATLAGNGGMGGFNFEGSDFEGSNSDSEFGKKDSLNLRSVEKSEGKSSEFFMQPQEDGKLSLKQDFAVASAERGAGAKTNVVHSPDSTQNMQQVMNQAQIMIRKGGGDAIVKLNPEGLGEIHLRVSVNDGKVNLQMSAETKEAKNLIESSMKDLKASLGAHNLKVDQVKVDVGNQASSDNNGSQKQNASEGGFKFDQQREQARQFLGNFQDENSANRGGFFEMPGLKAYNPRKGPEPLKPSTETSASSRRYAGEGRGNGLNLVV